MAGKVLVWLHGEVKTPPFSVDARRRTGLLLRLVQDGILLTMPDSRPMPDVGPRSHELRIKDHEMNVTWRIICRLDEDAVVIGDVFMKKTQKTPPNIIDVCQRRYRLYDHASR